MAWTVPSYCTCLIFNDFVFRWKRHEWYRTGATQILSELHVILMEITLKTLQLHMLRCEVIWSHSCLCLHFAINFKVACWLKAKRTYSYVFSPCDLCENEVRATLRPFQTILEMYEYLIVYIFFIYLLLFIYFIYFVLIASLHVLHYRRFSRETNGVNNFYSEEFLRYYYMFLAINPTTLN